MLVIYKYIEEIDIYMLSTCSLIKNFSFGS
jgi:hypothetical protein